MIPFICTRSSMCNRFKFHPLLCPLLHVSYRADCRRATQAGSIKRLEVWQVLKRNTTYHPAALHRLLNAIISLKLDIVV